MDKRKAKQLKVFSMTLACWGLLFIGSGVAMTTRDNTITKYSYTLNISKSKVAESKTNEIKLKDMILEVNTPLSVNVKDYLENPEKIDSSIIAALKLDTSNVKAQEAGSYIYTISYKKKKYNGTFTIKEKELPKVTLTLKNLTLKKDSVLDTNLSTYINEPLTDEIAKNIVLDLSAVKTNVEGKYLYSVTYNNKLYTAIIEIYTPQTTIITPNTPQEPENPSGSTTEDNTNTEVTP